MTGVSRPTVTYNASWIAAVVNGNAWGDYSYPKPPCVAKPYYFGD